MQHSSPQARPKLMGYPWATHGLPTGFTGFQRVTTEGHPKGSVALLLADLSLILRVLCELDHSVAQGQSSRAALHHATLFQLMTPPAPVPATFSSVLPSIGLPQVWAPAALLAMSNGCLFRGILCWFHLILSLPHTMGTARLCLLLSHSTARTVLLPVAP